MQSCCIRPLLHPPIAFCPAINGRGTSTTTCMIRPVRVLIRTTRRWASLPVQVTMDFGVASLQRDFPPGTKLWVTEYNTMYRFLAFYIRAPFFQNGAKSGFEMCFDIGSQHLGCWGQNTSRIQNKEVYAILCFQVRWRVGSVNLVRSLPFFKMVQKGVI